MTRITSKPNATRWTKTRVKSYGPFVVEKTTDTKILCRGTTPKPNGEQWYGWFELAEVEVAP